MSPTLKKFLITSGLTALVVTIGLIVSRGAGPTPATAPTTPSSAPADFAQVPAASDGAAPATAATTTAAPAATPARDTIGAATAPAGLIARVPAGMTAATAPAPLGSLDPAKAPFQIEFAANGAGISRLVFSDFWKSVDASLAAKKSRATNDPALMPSDSARYVLVASRKLQGFEIPELAVRGVEIDGNRVGVFGSVWADSAARPGVFTTEIADATGAPILRIERAFTGLGTDPSNKYLLGLAHEITNLDGKAHTVRLIQYGPGDPELDTTSLTEVRRFHFGYLYPPERDPTRSFVIANGQMFERSDVIKKVAAGDIKIWPDTTAVDGKYELSWFGVTDRYFSFAVHAPLTAPSTGPKTLGSIDEVRALTNGQAAPNDSIFTELWSPASTIEPGARANLAMGIYAGPLDPTILEGVQPYVALNMGDLIVYLMSGCCSYCTFSWLADFLLWFLTFIHNNLVFDWGLSIIGLVVVVRLVLHPLQKKSQISMQRFSRAMTAMKPELDQLQKKFKDEPARMQQEQMRMFRERGVSPAGCVGGMLPTFAQMPIWMALYAVLYFAFPLRHQAPFFGVFQLFNDWTFLADLSAPDRFFAFSAPLNLYIFTLSSINLLPVLMGIVFFIQQKYTTPPVTPNMSDDQIAQQKMMKWMMVVMFPVMTYVVPSGLTLYILTSTCIGIVEGLIIKKQVDAMDFSAKPVDGKKKQDFLGRMYEKALERSKDRQQAQKKYKDR